MGGAVGSSSVAGIVDRAQRKVAGRIEAYSYILAVSCCLREKSEVRIGNYEVACVHVCYGTQRNRRACSKWVMAMVWG
jgi:hypothetical protein